ncbi:MAG: sigma-54-dependent Fis family transcriptional regulator [Clostridiales bacterium]|nr:MAG: sigma-54-dependent Fis family transcriptional regulator [Clostridiales bacterium]
MNDSVKLLIVDDEIEYRETYRMLLENRGFIVGEAGSADEALDIMSKEYYPIVISDVIMPGKDGLYLLDRIKNKYGGSVEVIIVTGYGSIENAVKAIRVGALGYFIKSGNPNDLFMEIDKARRLVQFEKKKELEERNNGSGLFLHQAENPRIRKILEDIQILSDSSCNVLITGESGVGKEIFAKHIHDSSAVADGIFMATNCQAFSENLLEAELFGHEKGAFTGAAAKRIGRFEEANGGTMFLDEIGEISPSTQVKLLRVLDSRYIERIGSNKKIPVNFRLISATNRKLQDEISRGGFREDLYYRINTMTIEIPPLRERREDLEGMIGFFVSRLSSEIKKDIKGPTRETLRYLLEYDYPGNVRELKNIIERLIVLSKDGYLRMEQVEERKAKGWNTNDDGASEILPYKESKRRFEKEYISKVLSANQNNITKAAQFMGISRRQLFNKITEYKLKK